jgi:hypothetical protein
MVQARYEKRTKTVTYLLDTYFDLPLIARFSAWRLLAQSHTNRASGI